MSDTGAKKSGITSEVIAQMHELKAQGLSNRAIGERIGVSPSTVSKHCSSVLPGLVVETPPDAEEQVEAPAVDAYQVFVASKLTLVPPTGIEGVVVESEHLFPFQRDLVQWALRRGRAALFESTGLGKSRQEVKWARIVSEYTEKPVLILAPLAVATQTAREGASIGVQVTVCRESGDVRPGVNIANYERLHKFDPSVFGGVAMDESSVCKNYNSRTLAQLKDAFSRTAFRLAATATPSPNDYVELGTHAELLGICSRAEMLAEYFVHDGGDTQTWRLKGHARSQFWKFIASWGALVRSPADLGYDASAYELPPLHTTFHTIATDDEQVRASGMLFAEPARGLMEQRQARRGSLSERVKRCAEKVNTDLQPWVVWCELNDESDTLADAIPDAVEVRGAMSIEEKEDALERFSGGSARVIISKPSLTGFGLNWQHAARMAFVGVSNSWEQYHQAVRRCYRFGQKREVHVHLFASELEGNVAKNLQRKELAAAEMAEELSRETSTAVRESIHGSVRKTNEYRAPRIAVPEWMKGTGT